jgi:hypothetical protein
MRSRDNFSVYFQDRGRSVQWSDERTAKRGIAAKQFSGANTWNLRLEYIGASVRYVRFLPCLTVVDGIGTRLGVRRVRIHCRLQAQEE